CSSVCCSVFTPPCKRRNWIPLRPFVTSRTMLLRTFIAGILLTAGAFAQVSSFPKPSYFRETFQSARTTVELKDPVKLRDFVVEGKLELSLKHYLELVMANN